MKKLLKKILWLFPWLGNIIYKKELRTAGIKYKTGVYSGKKDLLIFASEDLKFLCSM